MAVKRTAYPEGSGRSKRANTGMRKATRDGMKRKVRKIQTLRAGNSEVQSWQEKSADPFRMPWKSGRDFRIRYT